MAGAGLLARLTSIALAAADEFSPTAAETRRETLRLFFATPALATRRRALLSHRDSRRPVEVDDEDWAAGRRSTSRRSRSAMCRRSRPLVSDPRGAGLQACERGAKAPRHDSDPPLISVIIRPSMGFGTGHHATTRLCLLALQSADLRGAFLLDVGTGSGILAIAAARLGAARVLGLDNDADAIQSANENLALNPGAGNVAFHVADLLTIVLPTADLIVANLTGALLARTAAALVGALSRRGLLIISGILADEEEMVDCAFTGVAVTQRRQEDEWRCLVMTKANAGGSRCKVTIDGSKLRGITFGLMSMRGRWLIAPLAVLLAGALSVISAQGPRPSQPQQSSRDTPAQRDAALEVPKGKISGRVVAADTGRPVRRARVSATAPELPEGRGTLTDDSGVSSSPNCRQGDTRLGLEDRICDVVLRSTAAAAGGNTAPARRGSGNERNRLPPASRQRHCRPRVRRDWRADARRDDPRSALPVHAGRTSACARRHGPERRSGRLSSVGLESRGLLRERRGPELQRRTWTGRPRRLRPGTRRPGWTRCVLRVTGG